METCKHCGQPIPEEITFLGYTWDKINWKWIKDPEPEDVLLKKKQREARKAQRYCAYEGNIDCHTHCRAFAMTL